MDTTAVAAAFAGSQASQVQMAMAAKMLKMNADQGKAVANMLDAAQQNIQAMTGSGIGQNLDVSA